MALQDLPGDERIQKQPHQLIQSLRDVPLCEQALPPAEAPPPHGPSTHVRGAARRVGSTYNAMSRQQRM